MEDTTATWPGGAPDSSTAELVRQLSGQVTKLGHATPPATEQATASVKADVEGIRERAHR